MHVQRCMKCSLSVFQNSWSHHQSPHLCQHQVLSTFLIFVSVIGIQWHFIIVSSPAFYSFIGSVLVWVDCRHLVNDCRMALMEYSGWFWLICDAVATSTRQRQGPKGLLTFGVLLPRPRVCVPFALMILLCCTSWTAQKCTFQKVSSSSWWRKPLCVCFQVVVMTTTKPKPPPAHLPLLFFFLMSKALY